MLCKLSRNWFLPLCSVVQSVVVIAAPWPASAKQSFSPSEAEWIYQPEEVAYYHPVLRVKAGHEFDPGAVTATTFRRLNKYKDSWEGKFPEKFNYRGFCGYFSLAEVGAAREFSRRVLHLEKQQIIALAGAPSFKGRGFSGWEWLSPKSEFWVYNLGGRWIPVYLVFEGNTCVRSGICSREQFHAYEEWRIRQICQFGPGKSYSSIVSWLGQPDSVSDAKGRKASSPKTPAKQIVSCFYQFSSGTGANIYFKNGICTGSDCGEERVYILH